MEIKDVEIGMLVMTPNVEWLLEKLDGEDYVEAKDGLFYPRNMVEVFEKVVEITSVDTRDDTVEISNGKWLSLDHIYPANNIYLWDIVLS